MEKPIYITEFDLVRLKTLLQSRDLTTPGNRHLDDLARELDRAAVVSSRDSFRHHHDELSVPSKGPGYGRGTDSKANIEKGMLSILAPVGTALLGYRLDDVVEWNVPMGKKRFSIEEILYQPEASGDYHL